MKSKNNIVVRMAPSPTGNLHIGTARTTLFNNLFVRERSTKAFEQNILDGLIWLGLEHDELYRQSEREDIYKKFLKQMLDSGFVYISKEEVTEAGQRNEVIRLKNPNKKVVFEDLVR